jgi:hypothetical protein
MVQAALDKLATTGTPDVILASHKSLFGRTEYVEISFPEFPNQGVHFLVQPYSRIEITADGDNNIPLLKRAAEKLGALINYDCLIV